MTTPRTLTEMQNRPTAYEVSIDGRVVGFTARKTKQALWGFARDNGKEIIAKLDAVSPGFDPAPEYKKGVLTFGPVIVKFTGRTEREAATKAMRG